MKKIIFISLLCFSWLLSQAQTPSFFNYQAIIQDAMGAPIGNRDVRLKVVITAPGGSFTETYNTQTNELGIINLQIGGADLGKINWAKGGGEVAIEELNFGIKMPSFPLASVPYALYAETSGSSLPGPPPAHQWDGTKIRFENPAGGFGPFIDLKGEQGNSVSVVGSVATEADLPNNYSGKAGDMFIVTNTGSGFVWDGTKWISVGRVQGPQGEKGDKGDMGSKGDAGAKGEPGVQGPKGDTGLQGLAGPAGPQGAKGDKGDVGNKGDKGTDGTSVSIVGSVANANQLPVSGNKGDLYIVTTTGDAFVWDGTKWVNVGKLQGPKGDTGEKGNKGDKGDTGAQGTAGAQGQTGSQGSQGVAGPIGPQGIKGDKGDIGAQGPKGDIGATGSVGVQGPKGDKGDTGNTGPQGNTGAQGAQGLKGDKGDTGNTGAQGAKGDTGATGAQGNAGAQGAQGLKGDKGDTGNTGAQGAKGDNGATGPQGNAGAQGPQGLKGDKGDTGAQGATGAQGNAGAQGLKGDKGDKGDTGNTGSQGAKGDTGATGAQGNAGAQGPQGLKGDKGDTGNTGAQGAKGDTGATGPQGNAGSQGAQGIQGLKGDKGNKGDTGDTGSQGATGPQGNSGSTGAQGPKGDKGDTGAQGPAGSYTAGSGIGIAAGVITNSGDTNASDDLTTNTNFAGDASGKYNLLTVTAIQKRNVSNANPSSGQALIWSGSAWTPTTISSGGGGPLAAGSINNDGSVAYDLNGNVSCSRSGSPGNGSIVFSVSISGQSLNSGNCSFVVTPRGSSTNPTTVMVSFSGGSASIRLFQAQNESFDIPFSFVVYK